MLIRFNFPKLDVIPTVGFSDPILSYFSAYNFIFRNTLMLKEGYEKVCISLIVNMDELRLVLF